MWAIWWILKNYIFDVYEHGRGLYWFYSSNVIQTKNNSTIINVTGRCIWIWCNPTHCQILYCQISFQNYNIYIYIFISLWIRTCSNLELTMYFNKLIQYGIHIYMKRMKEHQLKWKFFNRTTISYKIIIILFKLLFFPIYKEKNVGENHSQDKHVQLLMS